MKGRIASVTCRTEVNKSHRMAWRVTMEKNDSTGFINEEWVGVKCWRFSSTHSTTALSGGCR
jgi:hypothetical protein